MNGSTLRPGRPMPRLGVAAAACTLLACGGGGEPTPSGPNAPVLTTVSVTLASSTIQTGLTTTATASGRDQAGAAMSLGAVAWSSASPSVATVSSAGVVLGVSPGQATIIATAGGKQGSATITVEPAVFAGDFAIVDARFTQGVQDVDGAIPMVLSGNAAVVNVLVRAVPASPRSMQVALRIYDASGVVIRTDTAVTQGPLNASPTYDAPSVQFLVPASVLKPGLTWQVVRDPRSHVPDDSLATDVFPRPGPAPLATVTVPPLRIRFVPIVLASHGNATGAVSAGTIPDYLRTLLSVFPLGVVSAHVGTPLTTTASFGVPPSGGAAPFWQQVLQELDLARLADPEPDVNWYGVVVPPPGFNFTSFGGFSFIPVNGTSTGPGTRTSASVQTNWFNTPTQARDLVGHELGHTFGRRHAPCGGAGAPDMAYPVFGGTLEQSGHDVFAWANGLATSAPTVAATTGDVMGYCFPVWASAYTYRAVLEFRGPPVVAARQAEQVTRVLVVRGSITGGHSIALEPVFVLDARPAVPSGGGGYRLEGFDAAGRLLFGYDFEPFALDHAPEVRPFTVALPSTPDLEERLAAIVVRGPAGVQRIDRSPVLAGARIAELRETSVARGAGGMLAVTCASGAARGILALDAVTGAVLGSAAQSSMRLMLARGRELSIVCSDGVRTQQSRMVAP